MKKFLLFLIDLVILYASLFITLFIRYGFRFKDLIDIHLIPFTLVFILWLIIFYIANLYNISGQKNEPIFYSYYFKTIAIAGAFAIAFFYLTQFSGIAPKRNLFIFIAVFSILDFLARYGFNRLIISETFKNNIIIVGLNQQSIDLIKFIKSNLQLGYRLKYIYDISSLNITSPGLEGFGIINDLNHLNNILKNKEVQSVILSPQAYQIPHIIDIFYKALDKKIGFYNLSNFYERLTSKVPLGAIDQVWFLENLSEDTKRGYEILKRSLDVIFALIVGVISLIFYPFVILAIKWTSAGPIFYKQQRVGQGGRAFEIIKFRTMVKDAEKDGAIWAQENDPRITKIGRFLRKTRLDELPQIWNILKGEMSFVGPRAERPEFHTKLAKTVPFYEERYLIKPGLTGWAQIQFRYGASVADTQEKLQYDLYYIKHRSFILDLGIILKTINIVLRRGGR